MKKILLLVVLSAFLVGNFVVYAEGKAELMKLGKNMQLQKAVSGSEAAQPPCSDTDVIKADPVKVKALNDYFLPLQKQPKYYGDRRFRRLLRPWQVEELAKYKPNFGKKIWVKAWTFKDMMKKKKLFGKLIGKKVFYITAIEVADDVAPYMKKELEKRGFKDFERWAKRFEEFGRTYVNPDKAGKMKCHIEVWDFQNGNFIIVEATKHHRKKMAYFVSEDNDVIIKAALGYKTRAERKKEEKK
jgi:hypothetical protein